MAKILVLLTATLAIHTILARPENTNQRTVVVMKERLPTMINNVLNKLKSIQVRDENERRELVTHANDFASKLEEATHALFTIIIRTEKENSRQVLPEVGVQLNDIVHEVRQSILVQPTLIKDTIQDKVRKLEAEGKNLMEAADYFKGGNEKDNVEHDLVVVIDKILDALNELQRFDDTHHQSTDKLHGVTLEECIQLVKDLNETVDAINIFDKKTAHYMSREGYAISNFISHIIRHLDRESYYFDSNLKATVDAAAKQLRGVRVTLDGVLEGHKFGDPTEAVNALKEQMKATVHGYSQPIIALLSLTKSGNKYVEGNESFQNMAQMVVFDYMVTTRSLQAKMVQIGGGHPY